MIPKEDALFKTRPKSKINVQFRWINLISKSSWVMTTASCFSYKLGVNSEKKVINKNVQSKCHTGKPGNVNILRGT